MVFLSSPRDPASSLGLSGSANRQLHVRISATVPRIAAVLGNAVVEAGAVLARDSAGNEGGASDVDVVLIWYADIIEELGTRGIPDGASIVAALTWDRLLEASLHTLDVDGWFFLERQMPHIGEILKLSGVSHCLVPSGLSSIASIDRLRRDRMEELTAYEREVLDCLGRGLQNRKIAQAMGMTESSVKSLVRSVLSKLRLANRTSAGVFAALHGRSGDPSG